MQGTDLAERRLILECAIRHGVIVEETWVIGRCSPALEDATIVHWRPQVLGTRVEHLNLLNTGIRELQPRGSIDVHLNPSQH